MSVARGKVYESALGDDGERASIGESVSRYVVSLNEDADGVFNRVIKSCGGKII